MDTGHPAARAPLSSVQARGLPGADQGILQQERHSCAYRHAACRVRIKASGSTSATLVGTGPRPAGCGSGEVRFIINKGSRHPTARAPLAVVERGSGCPGLNNYPSIPPRACQGTAQISSTASGCLCGRGRLGQLSAAHVTNRFQTALNYWFSKIGKFHKEKKLQINRKQNHLRFLE